MLSRNEFGGSKADVLVKLVLVFFICLFSFSIGTFVGKNFSDSQYKLAQLEQDYKDEDSGDRQTASVRSLSQEAKPKNLLSDAEIAKLAEEFSAESTEDSPSPKGKEAKSGMGVQPEVSKERSSQHPEQTSASQSSVKAHVAADRIVKGQAPVTQSQKKGTEVKRQVASLPGVVASSSIGKYTVQIASHPNEQDAIEHSQKLKKLGYAAFYIPAKVEGKTWYRIGVGLFVSRSEAILHRKKIIGTNGIQSAIIQKIVK